MPTTSGLPNITDSVTIDATTQPGYAGAPLVEIRGDLAGVGARAFVITSAYSTIRGFAINRFANSGSVVIAGTSAHENTIAGNFIGTNAAGTAALPNQDGLPHSGRTQRDAPIHDLANSARHLRRR